MRDIHKGLPYKGFTQPQSGLASARVCSVSGLIPSDYCNEGTIELLFLEGTQPVKVCDIHKDQSKGVLNLLTIITGDTKEDSLGLDIELDSTITMPSLDSEIKIDLPIF